MHPNDDCDKTADMVLEGIDQYGKTIMEELGLDGVQIIGTYCDADGYTRMVTAGAGNWHARYGALCEVKDTWSARLRGQAGE